MCLPLLRSRRAVPKMARLLLSVPPEVKMISLGLARKKLATRSRASSRQALARRPIWWTLEGLPQISFQYGCMALLTAGSSGVVAL